MATLYEISKVCDADGCTEVMTSGLIESPDDSDLTDVCMKKGWAFHHGQDFCLAHSHTFAFNGVVDGRLI